MSQWGAASLRGGNFSLGSQLAVLNSLEIEGVQVLASAPEGAQDRLNDCSLAVHADGCCRELSSVTIFCATEATVSSSTQEG